MEVGIDIELNQRFENVSERFLKKVFSEREYSYAKTFIDHASKLCAMWCVKEAVIKAFSDANFSFLEIEVLRDNNGKPFVNKTSKLCAELEKRGLSEIKISLSHSKTHSTAICILN